MGTLCKIVGTFLISLLIRLNLKTPSVMRELMGVEGTGRELGGLKEIRELRELTWIKGVGLTNGA